jgi:hypothetical protein
MTEMVAQEVAEPTGGLEFGGIGVQVQPVNASNLERDVAADNVGEVGHAQNLLAEIPAMVLLWKDVGLTTGPNIVSEASPQTARHVAFNAVYSAV